MSTQIDINTVGNMSLHQQMAHAKRNGADSFISTDGRLYILRKGKWELAPQPKEDLKHFQELSKLASLLGEDYVKSVKMMAAMHGYKL